VPHRCVHDKRRRGPGRAEARGGGGRPTSGNTGIALAFVCAARGYKLTLCMPETFSQERRRVLASFGANLVLTPRGGHAWRHQTRRSLGRIRPRALFPAPAIQESGEPRIHELTTGPEIWSDTDGKVDVLVSGVGTGGTLTGSRASGKRSRASRCIRWRSSRPRARSSRRCAAAPAQARAAQNPRHRRRLHSRHTRPQPGRSGGTGQRRGSD